LLRVTNDGARTQRPEIIYARNFIRHSMSTFFAI
jgi:hypothetical protein